MIASDTMSYLFDPQKAMEKLVTLEKGWGGTPAERQARQMAAFRLAKAIEKGQAPPPAAAAANGSEAANATAPTASTPAASTPAASPPPPATPPADADDGDDLPAPPGPGNP